MLKKIIVALATGFGVVLIGNTVYRKVKHV